MKRILLLLVLVSFYSSLFSAGIRDDKTKEEVKLESGPAQNDRSLNKLVCFIDRSMQTIEVEYAEVGVPMIAICDLQGNIYSYEYGNVKCGIVVLNLPSTVGVYQILIQSNSVTAVGTFNVF